MEGTAFYADRHVKVDEGWRIDHTGYMRVFEEHRHHSTLACARSARDAV